MTKYVAVAIVAAVAAGCAGTQAAPPCDSATIAVKLAECLRRVEQCEPAPAPCPAEEECLRWADERQEVCQ